jgi:hypothetical protein
MIWFIDVFLSKWTYIIIGVLLALTAVGLLILGGLTNWAGLLTGTGGGWSWQNNVTQKAGLVCGGGSFVLLLLVYLIAGGKDSSKKRRHHRRNENQPYGAYSGYSGYSGYGGYNAGYGSGDEYGNQEEEEAETDE